MWSTLTRYADSSHKAVSHLLYLTALRTAPSGFLVRLGRRLSCVMDDVLSTTTTEIRITIGGPAKTAPSLRRCPADLHVDRRRSNSSVSEASTPNQLEQTVAQAHGDPAQSATRLRGGYIRNQAGHNRARGRDATDVSRRRQHCRKEKSASRWPIYEESSETQSLCVLWCRSHGLYWTAEGGEAIRQAR